MFCAASKAERNYGCGYQKVDLRHKGRLPGQKVSYMLWTLEGRWRRLVVTTLLSSHGMSCNCLGCLGDRLIETVHLSTIDMISLRASCIILVSSQIWGIVGITRSAGSGTKLLAWH